MIKDLEKPKNSDLLNWIRTCYQKLFDFPIPSTPKKLEILSKYWLFQRFYNLEESRSSGQTIRIIKNRNKINQHYFLIPLTKTVI